MSYYHREMHPALRRHREQSQHKLLSHPVALAGEAVPPLTYHGGPTIRSPKVVALYAGQFWSDKNRNDQFLADVVQNGYLSAGGPQGFGSGQFLGSFAIPAPPSGALTDSDCQQLIAAAVGRNGVPSPDASTIYVLLLPDGVSVSLDGESSCAQFCAYHSQDGQFVYTVQPANTCAGCNEGDPFVGLCMTEAHEIAEACSDPYGTGWYNDQTGEENADEVAWIAEAYGPWTVQGYAGQDQSGSWVNLVGAYSPPQPPPPQPGPGPQPDPRVAEALAALQPALAAVQQALQILSTPS